MSRNVKTGLISLMGALGLIALLIGIFTDAYSFGIGLVILLLSGSEVVCSPSFWESKRRKLRLKARRLKNS